jgi:Tfp pilus assembly protein PilO
VTIKSAPSSTVYDQLTMDVTAKTYRYLDDEEVASSEAAKRAAKKGNSQ